MLHEEDFRLSRYMAAHILIILSYALLIYAMVISSAAATSDVVYYFSIYILSNIFNHLTFFAKIKIYPDDEVNRWVPKNKMCRWVLYFTFLVPVSFPEWEVMKSIAYVFFVFESNCYCMVEITRITLIMSFMVWIFLLETVQDRVMMSIAFLIYTTLALYRHR